MTDKYWQKEAKRRERNETTIIHWAEKEKKAIASRKHPKELYAECMRKSGFIRQWEQSEELSVEDAAMLLCRDKGCELTYCQATMADPYEQPFKDCEEHARELGECMVREQRRYNYTSLGVPLNEYLKSRMEMNDQVPVNRPVQMEKPVEQPEMKERPMTMENKF